MIRVALALCRLCQLAYPRDFRARFGRDLLSVTESRLGAARKRSVLRAAGLALWLAADAVASGVAERRHASRLRWFDRRHLHRHLPRSQTMSTESLLLDLRVVVRRLTKAPVFALVTIATLALGIGATTAIFSVANAVLLRPLPYNAPDELVAIWSHNVPLGERQNPVSPANFAAFRDETSSFTGVEATYSFLVNHFVEIDGAGEMVVAATVSPGMFDLIGRPARYGRTLGAGDEWSVVLSHGFWMRRFGGDPAVVGRTVRVPGAPAPFTIVGVMPDDFVFPYKSMLGPSGFSRAVRPDVWVPLSMNTGRMVDAAGQPNRTIHMLAVIGRLRPDASIAAARAEVDAIAARRAAQFPDTNDGWQATVLPLHEQAVGQVRPVVLLLGGGVAVLLLMMCVNIANVLLARATAQQKDLTVRAVLGASTGRLVQLSLVESAVLATLGGLAGVGVAIAGAPAIVALAPADLPRLDETRLDLTVFAFAGAVSILAGLAVGLLPALASRRNRGGTTFESVRTTASRSRRRIRSGLIVAELALATVLASGAALMVRSYTAVANVDPGFRSGQLLTFQQSVPVETSTPAAQVAFFDEFIARVSALPGVTDVGGTTRIPLGSTQVTTNLDVEGRDVPMARRPEVEMRRAVGDYFQAMGMPVLRGRAFEASDRTATDGLAIVNAALADQVFPGEDAVGRRVRMGPNPAAPWLTIVGVVGDIRHSSLEEAPRPEIYISYLQGPPTSPFMVARTAGDPAGLVAEVRRIAQALGANPPFNVSTMESLRAESMALRRFTVLLAGLFGALALVLAACGIYGVTALVVAERTDEVGVRMALGATPSRILRMVTGQTARLGAVGVALGLASSLALAQVARGLLFGIGPSDPWTFTVVPAGLLLVALVAAVVPARRATRISPMQAIKG